MAAEHVTALLSGDPAAARAHADTWADVASSFYSRAADLEARLRQFDPYWTGAAAEQYKLMIRGLIDGLRRVADVARLITDNVYTAGESLAAAQRMPPHPAVLTELARRYAALQAALPAMPAITGPPPITQVLDGTYQPDPALLFSGVYGNGLASAASALGGRFQRAVGRLPLSPDPAVLPTGTASPIGALPSPAPGGAAPLPPITAEPPVIGVGRASVEPPSPPPVAANSPMMGGGFLPPMIPPMGMAGGGGDGFGNDRHVPHWLTEPEPEVVFGVPLQAMMPIIGE